MSLLGVWLGSTGLYRFKGFLGFSYKVSKGFLFLGFSMVFLVP